MVSYGFSAPSFLVQIRARVCVSRTWSHQWTSFISGSIVVIGNTVSLHDIIPGSNPGASIHFVTLYKNLTNKVGRILQLRCKTLPAKLVYLQRQLQYCCFATNIDTSCQNLTNKVGLGIATLPTTLLSKMKGRVLPFHGKTSLQNLVSIFYQRSW